MQSKKSDKTPYLRPFKRLPPKTLIIFFCLAVALGIASTAHASFFSFLSPISNAQASDQSATSASSGQSSQTMPILEAPSANPQLADNDGSSSLPPIDGDVLSPDLAAANQASGADTSNAQISSYIVQSDDTLSGIADMFDISVDTIKQANGLSGNSIHPGETLVILPVTGVLYTVKSGDTISGIAKQFKVDQGDIVSYNESLSASTALSKGMQLVIPNGKTSLVQTASYVAKQNSKVPSFEPLLDPVWEWSSAPAGYYTCPVPGAVLTQGLHGHNAVDLAIKKGTPIHAAAAGTVIISKSNGAWNGGYGNFVMISHDNGSETLYGHMMSTMVHVGDRVSQGDVIGLVGSTGMSTGPHVHFEIRGKQNPFVDQNLCKQ